MSVGHPFTEYEEAWARGEEGYAPGSTDIVMDRGEHNLYHREVSREEDWLAATIDAARQIIGCTELDHLPDIPDTGKAADEQLLGAFFFTEHTLCRFGVDQFPPEPWWGTLKEHWPGDRRVVALWDAYRNRDVETDTYMRLKADAYFAGDLPKVAAGAVYWGAYCLQGNWRAEAAAYARLQLADIEKLGIHYFDEDHRRGTAREYLPPNR